jgi:3-hydroxyacyl-[acyl-carrier-protein] dehydratase
MAVVRRDLKVPANVPLDPDAPLIGGAMDIDSLDLLLVVVGLDKEFGVKIAGPQMGREVFGSLRTLAAYVDRQLHGASTPPDPVGVPLDALLERLPHRPPFRFVTRLLGIGPGRDGSATWEVDGSELFFTGHFPGRPLVPGVLLIEAMAQLSGLVSTAAHPGKNGSALPEARLARTDVKFLAPVVPPARVELSSTVAGTADGLTCYDVRAVVRDRTVAEGSLVLSWG